MIMTKPSERDTGQEQWLTIKSCPQNESCSCACFDLVHRRNKNQNTILFLTSVCLRLVFFLTSLIPPLLRSLRKIKTSVAWNTRLKFNFIKTLFNGSKSYGFERCGEWRWVHDDINVSWVNKSCCKLNQLLYPFMSSSSRHSLFRFTLPVSFFHFLKRSDGQKQIVKSQMFTSEWRHWKVRRLPLSLQRVLAKPDCARNGWKNGGEKKLTLGQSTPPLRPPCLRGGRCEADRNEWTRSGPGWNLWGQEVM